MPIYFMFNVPSPPLLEPGLSSGRCFLHSLVLMLRGFSFYRSVYYNTAPSPRSAAVTVVGPAGFLFCPFAFSGGAGSMHVIGSPICETGILPANFHVATRSRGNDDLRLVTRGGPELAWAHATTGATSPLPLS